MPVPHEQRYVRIQIVNHLSPEDTIALIGHELRHALEVAAAPEVRDQKGLMELYQRIGEPGGKSHCTIREPHRTRDGASGASWRV